MMMMLRNRARAIFAVCLTLIMVLTLVPACAKPSPTPTTTTPTATTTTTTTTEKPQVIKVGASPILTGPIAAQTAPTGHGILAYLNYVNDTLGGISYKDPATGKTKQAKLDIVWEDNGFSVDKALAIYQRQKEAGVKAMIVHGSSPAPAISVQASKDSMPVVAVANLAATVIEPKPLYATGLLPSYKGQFWSWLKETKDTWPLSRPPVIGAFVANHPALGAPVVVGVDEFAKSLGIDLQIEMVPAAPTDTTVELKRLLGKNPDYVFIQHGTPGATVILNDAFRLGLTDKTTWFLAVPAFDPLALTVADPKAKEGLRGIVNAVPADQDVSGLKVAREAVKKYYNEDLVWSHVAGWVGSAGLVEGIRIALEKVGFENLTGQAINDGLHSIKDWDTGGIQPKVTIDPQKPVLMPWSINGVVKSGKIETFGSWFKSLE